MSIQNFTEDFIMDDKIVSRPIRDSHGRLVGNVTGRREQIDKVSDRDYLEQIKRDNDRARDNQRR